MPQAKQTRLALSSARRLQLQHVQLPQLQNLDVAVAATAAGELLLLGHMTALAALVVEGAGSWPAGDQLPPNLRTLKLVLEGSRQVDEDPYSSTAAFYIPRSISLQPVLGLGQLQELHLGMWCVGGWDVPAAAEVAQLSTLRSLQEVCIRWDSYQIGDDRKIQGIAAAFAVLPLKALTWRHAGMSAAVMQRLGSLQGLTSLELDGRAERAGDLELYGIKFTQLAVALRQLAALQYLAIRDDRRGYIDNWTADNDDDDEEEEEEEDNCDGEVELLQAVDGLQHLRAIKIDVPVLKRASLAQLDNMQQLVPNLLARGWTATGWQSMTFQVRIHIKSKAK
jgi:hypothetical protein